jgi:hypothetical protein
VNTPLPLPISVPIAFVRRLFVLGPEQLLAPMLVGVVLGAVWLLFVLATDKRRRRL